MRDSGKNQSVEGSREGQISRGVRGEAKGKDQQDTKYLHTCCKASWGVTHFFTITARAVYQAFSLMGLSSYSYLV